MNAAGVALVRGVELWRPGNGVVFSPLDRALRTTAREMPKEDGLPTGIVSLHADTRVPYEYIYSVLQMCRSPLVQIWKIHCDVLTNDGMAGGFWVYLYIRPAEATKYIDISTEDGWLLYDGMRYVDIASLVASVAMPDEPKEMRLVPKKEMEWGALLRVLSTRSEAPYVFWDSGFLLDLE